MMLSLLPLLFLAGEWPAEVEEALVFAGDNRAEIESVLEHYAAGDDPQKLEAACFLVANMPGHGYVEYRLCDAEGNELPWDALAYGSYAEARTAIEALEAEHGELDFEKEALVEDLHVMRADALIRNVDLAFRTWRQNPWARDLSFATFCEHILPHRGSNEPLEDWRGPYVQRLDEILADLREDASAAEVARRMSADASRRVGFNEIYYLHPTDQGYAEMLGAGRGRCEDITNMTTYAQRAAGVASAADYTPWWGHSDNNHAWPVILDAEGRGSSGDGARAAKVYRKTYSKQRGNLAFQLREGEQAPPWLGRETYRDVTDQYGPTSDVTVRATRATQQRFAYLCVFNGGEWRPIHWAHMEENRAVFDRMGRGLLYLPATYEEGEVRPLAAPFFLTKEGEVQPLVAGEATVEAALPSATRKKLELDEEGRPISQLTPGAVHELFVWRDGWESLGKGTAGDQPLPFSGLPAGALFWLVEEGSRKLERPFRLDGGRQVWM